MRGWALGVAVGAITPIVLGVAAALGLWPGDSFWIVTPFVGLPLAGVLVGLTVGRVSPRRAGLVAAVSVPIGVRLGWIVALLLSIPLDPSQNTAGMLFFALLSTLFLPWWLLPLLVAMGLAWWIGGGRWRGSRAWLE